MSPSYTGKWYYTSTSATTTSLNWTTANDTAAGWITFAPTPAYSVHQAPEPIRQSPPREFNRYINGSDLLEEFIRWLGTQHVKQDEALALPMDLFVKWLIIRACEQDGEEPNVTLELPAPKAQPRCLGCGQFMVHNVAFPVHSGRCADMYISRKGRAE